MKFLCDQCKAKYQISDDKVAGKTVRMKCRKCGHQIEVRAAVTETSVSSALPTPDGSSTASSPPPAQQGGGARAPAAPRAGGMATSLSAARPAAPRAPTQPSSALAGAFKSTVQKEPEDAGAAKELLSISANDEWYCAINGVPVGPIRVTELRRKAALGAVTEDSLVWQEGLEEWRTAKSIPELAALIRDAVASGRPSLVTPQPPEASHSPARASLPPPAPTQSSRPAPLRQSAGGIPRAAEAPPAPPRAAARNNVVPITSRLATAEKLDDVTEVAPERISAVATDPFAMAPPPPAALPASSVLASSATAPLVPMEIRRQPPWVLIAMFVLAGAFGITAAIVLFLRPQPAPAPPPAPVVIQIPGAAPAPTPAPNADSIPPPPSDSASPAASAGRTGGTQHAGGAGGGKPAASAQGKPVDPSVAALLQGVGGGPSTGPAGGGGGGGGSLTADQVEAVVRNHSLGVRRSCWERGGSSAPSANITAQVTVGGSGAVQNVNASGNDPVVAKCIEGAVRAWQFPPTGSTTTVNIPFHFVRQ